MLPGEEAPANSPIPGHTASIPQEGAMYSAMRKFFTELFEGDPVALTVAGVILAIIVIFFIWWWRIDKKMCREDEEHKQRLGGKKSKNKDT